MIFQAIDCIQKQIDPTVHTAAGNIAEIVSGTNNTDADIIITLINIEENRVSRDPRNYLKSGTNLFLKKPAIHLYLTLLFTALRSETAYGLALQNLQKVVQFFQGKYVFDHNNTTDLDVGIEKLILDMVSLNTEQLNNVWSILGGKYQPSVIYKMRMITIDSITDQQGSFIKEMESNYTTNET
jgi:hypothetical protein